MKCFTMTLGKVNQVKNGNQYTDYRLLLYIVEEREPRVTPAARFKYVT
jgi:hypothetical protein